MILTLHRFASLAESTLGALSVDGRFVCFSLEDQHQNVKVPGETRIPAGTYQIRLRIEGGMHERYKAKYDDHVGMLWLQNVPGFEWVYIHPGNDPSDTLGCILVGDTAQAEGLIERSVQAYRRLYRAVAAALLTGEAVQIEVRD